jgi:hypothetical protein
MTVSELEETILGALRDHLLADPDLCATLPRNMPAI